MQHNSRTTITFPVPFLYLVSATVLLYSHDFHFVKPCHALSHAHTHTHTHTYKCVSSTSSRLLSSGPSLCLWLLQTGLQHTPERCMPRTVETVLKPTSLTTISLSLPVSLPLHSSHGTVNRPLCALEDLTRVLSVANYLSRSEIVPQRSRCHIKVCFFFHAVTLQL